MSKFSNWADKLFVDMDKEMEKTLETTKDPLQELFKKEESVEEIERKIKNMDIGYEKYVKNNGFDSSKHHMFSDIRNRLFRDLTIAKVKQYDTKKVSENPKYISYKDAMKTEVIDQRLDSLLKAKLDIEDKETTKLSKKDIDEIKRQEAIALDRSNKFQDRISLLRNTINNYDKGKQIEDPNYLSYEDQCIENEKTSAADETNYKNFKTHSKEVVEDLDKNFIDRLLESTDPDKMKPLSNMELINANNKIEQDAELYVKDICKKYDLVFYPSPNSSFDKKYYYNEKSGAVYLINGYDKINTFIKNIRIGKV